MLGILVKKIVGTKQARELRRLWPLVERINSFYEQYRNLSDEELRGKTEEFKARFKQGESLDDLLPEAFAAVKEACRRLVGKQWMAGGNEIIWDMIPFDVQLVGAVALHEGKIAEMATGEGKTLVATMPLYLNALTGRGVHLVTVNDYLAQRDAEWMGPVYEMLGLTVGCIVTGMDPAERREQYARDVTYGTNNEFGFDYLRDNMAIAEDHVVQPDHYYAIVDEVDSVLIDEARTPLIISGPVTRSTHRYFKVKPLVEQLFKRQALLVNRLLSEAEEKLKEDPESWEGGKRVLLAQRGSPKNKRLLKMLQDAQKRRLMTKVEAEYMRDKKMHELDAELFFVIDERSHVIDLTEKGRQTVAPDNPDMFVLKDIVDELAQLEGREDLTARQKASIKEKILREHEAKTEELHNISQLLRAYNLFERDVDYVIQDGKVIIVDEFTGRLMPGRRYSDGLHQALESKEGVEIETETQTLATITLQNYFRMYEKLAGMTGTAATEAEEFSKIYKMDVVVIPTNKPVRRVDYDDEIYRTKREKYNALVEEIARLNEMGLPVLVGTVSVEVSELLSRMLKRRGLSHNVLNAKNHAREALIIREAGKPAMVTIATNMAGRGTDIKLGKEVVKCAACCIRCEENCQEMAECKGVKSSEEYKKCLKEVPCGLQIVGTERHEARRIDLQLRGRSGRQGDPGASQFFLSLEDDLMRLFAPERVSGILGKLGLKEGEPIVHPMITRTIAGAQKKIESINFERRKRTLDYDNVMNRQRETVYGLRRDVLLSTNTIDTFLNVCYAALENEFISKFGEPKHSPDTWDVQGFTDWLQRTVPLEDFSELARRPWGSLDELLEHAMGPLKSAYEKKQQLIGEEQNQHLTRFILLRVIDTNWQDHLLAIDHLMEGIHLRAYAQRDPLIEYQREATRMFEELMYQIYKGALEHYFRTEVVTEEERAQGAEKLRFAREDKYHTQEMAMAAAGRQQQAGESAEEGGKPQPVRRGPKIGRNDPCPCGSGKKYKKCCGAPQRTQGQG